jgi:UDP-N-acetylglucosamine 2-epimerase (non-hydrolysing)/GDP/UDP-N,N'-diacetylbacillosamine 2-epimerase (hydrolysing)
VRVVASLGIDAYFGALREASVVLGNSSSGIIEAPALRVPTVNVGERQRGRVRAASVLDVPGRADAIVEAVQKALDPEFRRRLASVTSPFGDGHAAERIAAVLGEWEPGGLPHKVFRGFPSAPDAAGPRGPSR